MRQLHNLRLFIFIAALIIFGESAKAQYAFLYQGQLMDNNAPANGVYNLEFRLYDALSGGTPIGQYNVNNQPVLKGLFTASIDFGLAPFNGQTRYLEISVNGATLTPRQRITPTPYSLFASQTPWSGILNKPSSFTPGGSAGGDLTGAYPNPQIKTDASLLDKVSGGNMRVSGSNIGVGVADPQEKLSVSGVIQSMIGGFKFPDGTIQTTAMLLSEQIGFKSGLTGGQLEVLIDGEIGQSPAILAGPYVEEYEVLENIQTTPQGERIPRYSPQRYRYGSIKLRRMAVENSQWAKWAQQNSSGAFLEHSLIITLYDQNGSSIVRWQASNATVSRYELNLMDDGVPVEEITLDFPYNGRLQREQLNIIPQVRPELGMRKGATSGKPAGTTSLIEVQGQFLEHLILASNIARHADVSEVHQLGNITHLVQGAHSDFFTVRQNPASSKLMYDWFKAVPGSQRERQIGVSIAGLGGGLFIVFSSPKAWPYKYTLRMADDGLPVEEYSIAYELEHP